MIFKIYECDFGITLNGVNYEFDHVENAQIDDPETTELIRGGNAGNKLGLVYTQGLKEPKTMTLTVIGIPMDLHNLLKAAYANKTRMDAYIINRADGSKKTAKNAILASEPKQASVSDAAESMNTALVFKSFDVSEEHKS